jgi:endonuclease-3
MTIPNINIILNKLSEIYPDPRCELVHKNPFELLVATILSAQCTDLRVNKVTVDLFKKYQSVEDFANAEQLVLEGDVRTTGFFRNKARMIIECSKKLINDFDSTVPNDMEQLLTLSGVGRKTASVILASGFGIPAIAVDTHVIRLSNRIGLVNITDPEKIEWALRDIVPKDKWIFYSMSIVLHGRRICKAKKPLCSECVIYNECLWINKTIL